MAQTDLRKHRTSGRLLRLAMGVLGIIGLVAAVEGWKPLFPHRLGDVVKDGITASTDFQRVNRLKTRQAKEKAAAGVPYIFRHDPSLLDGLSRKLRSSLTDIAEADAIEDLPQETLDAFGLTQQMNDEFDRLKLLVSPTGVAAGNRLDDLVKEFDGLISELKLYGVADRRDFDEKRISVNDSNILVVGPTNEQEPKVAKPADVLLEELIKPTDRLGKSWEKLSEFRLPGIPDLMNRWLLSQTPVTLRYDSQATNEAIAKAQEEVGNVTDDYKKGQLLVQPGERIGRYTMDELRTEYDTIVSMRRLRDHLTRAAAAFVLILVLAVLNGYYLIHNEPHLVRSVSRLGIYLAFLVATVVVARIASLDPWRAEIFPLMTTVMVFAIAYNQRFATLSAVTLSLIIASSTAASLEQLIVLMSVAAIAIILLGSVASHFTLVKVGFVSGAVYFFVSWGAGVIQIGASFDVITDAHLLVESLKGAGWCLLVGFLVAGCLPFIEWVFSVRTKPAGGHRPLA